jgi:hypothetical protein
MINKYKLNINIMDIVVLITFPIWLLVLSFLMISARFYTPWPQDNKLNDMNWVNRAAVGFHINGVTKSSYIIDIASCKTSAITPISFPIESEYMDGYWHKGELDAYLENKFPGYVSDIEYSEDGYYIAVKISDTAYDRIVILSTNWDIICVIDRDDVYNASYINIWGLHLGYYEMRVFVPVFLFFFLVTIIIYTINKSFMKPCLLLSLWFLTYVWACFGSFAIVLFMYP